MSWWIARAGAIACAALCLAGCAGYDGGGLVPGQSRSEDVIRTMGEPALRWQNPDGSMQFSYPRGPMGVHSYMVRIDAAGRLARIENVMDMAHFAEIAPGMTQAQVLAALGPPEPSWTVYFPVRDELVWEWRYCDDWNALARFDVLFDGTAGTVRSTMSRREDCHHGQCWCGH